MLKSTGCRPRLWPSAWCAFLAVLIGLTGCEVDTYLNPSVVGRWERTPVVLPILDELDIIDETNADPVGLSDVTPEDLIPEATDYIMGPGDLLLISVYELMTVGQDSMHQRRVDSLGNIRIQMVGEVRAEGKTAKQLEQEVATIVERKGLVKNPLVTVIVQDPQHNTYSVVGEPRQSGTAVGTYRILRPDFRVLEAMALARGVSGRIKTIHVIRQVRLTEPQIQRTRQTDQRQDADEMLVNPDRLLEQALEQPQAQPPAVEPAVEHLPAPHALEQSVDRARYADQWAHVGGKWVRLTKTDVSPTTEAQVPAAVVTQRVIAVAYKKLLEGDMRNNVVIRPGDIISVPSPVIGNVYIMGAVARPGTYFLPGDKDLTLKLLVASAGGLSAIAWPERVDLTRRVGDNLEATVRLNLRAIFEGQQPDFFLKPNDMINVGQSFVSLPIAVVRSGFRATYGFGFILDRNFGPDVFSHMQDNRRR